MGIDPANRYNLSNSQLNANLIANTTRCSEVYTICSKFNDGYVASNYRCIKQHIYIIDEII